MIPLQMKLAAAGVALVALGVLWWVVDGWREEAARVPQLEQTISDMERAQKHAQEVSRDYQKQLADLRITRPAAPVVRMCIPRVQAPADHAGGHRDRREGDRVLPREDGGDYRQGPDIGGDLRDLAEEAEVVNAALQACLRANSG